MIDVEECALRAFEEDTLIRIRKILKNLGHVRCARCNRFSSA